MDVRSRGSDKAAGRRAVGTVLVVACLAALGAAVRPAAAQEAEPQSRARAAEAAAAFRGALLPDRTLPEIHPPEDRVAPVRSRPARTLVTLRPTAFREMADARRGDGDDAPPAARPAPRPPDPLLRAAAAAKHDAPPPAAQSATVTDFDGIGFGDTAITPPDASLDVGPRGVGAGRYVMQAVNLAFDVFDETGAGLLGGVKPLTGPDGLWDSDVGGTVCYETAQSTDPVVVYDAQAARWVVAHYASETTGGEGRACVAVSDADDPTGTYALYDFDLSYRPDYIKLGVWPDATHDAYFVASYQSQGSIRVTALDRANMVLGQAARAPVEFGVNNNLMLPADLDGATLPPSGTPGLFYTFVDEAYWEAQLLGNDFCAPGANAAHCLELWSFSVDWDTPGNSTFTELQTVPLSAFNYTVCGYDDRSCIPQPDVSAVEELVDAVSEWPMWRLQYRHSGTTERLLGNFTVDVTGSQQAGIRWFELERTTGAWSLAQEGTLGGADEHRWLGSIARNGAGAVAMGYSASDTDLFPAVRYAYRTSADAAGSLPNEGTVLTSTASQTGGNRWGDYSALVVDPVDDAAFWYTNAYIVPVSGQSGGNNWQTRVARLDVSGGLPVALADFAAYADDGGVALRWTTRSEDANAGFEVQHRPAGAPPAQFRRLGFVEGGGTTVEGRSYAYRADDLRPGVHRFRLRQVDFDGAATFTPEVEVRIAPPAGFALSAPYPNPFDDAAQIVLTLRHPQSVRVDVFDVLGRHVARLHDGPLAADREHVFRLDGGILASGLYVVRAAGASFTASRAVTRRP